MDTTEAIKITKKVFEKIEIANPENIDVKNDILSKEYEKNYVNQKNSPKISFNISKDDLKEIKKQLNEDLRFKEDI